MQGFDYERARADLEVPDNFDVMAMIAIGKQGPKENLPLQLQEREQPNARKPLAEIVMEGQFKKYSVRWLVFVVATELLYQAILK
jgi:hypothetical protein